MLRLQPLCLCLCVLGPENTREGVFECFLRPRLPLHTELGEENRPRGHCVGERKRKREKQVG